MSYPIVRIDGVEKQGTTKIVPASGKAETAMPCPVPAYKPADTQADIELVLGCLGVCTPHTGRAVALAGVTQQRHDTPIAATTG